MGDNGMATPSPGGSNGSGSGSGSPGSYPTNKSSGSDFNANGNGMFAGSGNQSSTAADYYKWTWKEIEAAINGGSEIATAAGQKQASALSNPQTLWDAGNLFEYFRQLLNMVAQALSDQAKALAGGDNAPWKGAAADAFLNTMTLFSKQVQANADVLSGGPAGMDPVPQQLINNGNALSKAQTVISAIDNWYANQAKAMGVQPMSNGLVPISQKPKLVQMMTNDMLNDGLLPLVANYQITIDAVVSPTAITAGPGSGNGSGSGSGSGSHVPGNSGKSNPSNFPGGASGNSPGGSGANVPGGAGASSPAGFPGGASGANVPGGAGASSPAGFPGGTRGANVPGGAGASSPAGFPGANLANVPGGAGASSPAGFPGGAGNYAAMPGTGSSNPAPFAANQLATSPNGGLSDSGLHPYDGGAVPATGTNLATSPAATAFPGLAGIPAAAASKSKSGIGGAAKGLSPAATAFPGTSGIGGAAKGLSPAATAFPGTSGIGGAAKGLSPTAAGALSPLTQDRLAGSPLATSPAAGTIPGESKLSANGGEQMPYMPGMGGMGAAGGTSGLERPDAAGLLGGEAEPWNEDALEGDGAEALPGAEAGGPGLDGLPAEDAELAAPATGSVDHSAPEAEQGAMVGADGMPFLPGMVAMGAAGEEGGSERPDAAGLLGAETEAWAEAGVVAEPGEAQAVSHWREEPPANRVAVLPQAESPDDIDAWDTAAAGASFLMFAESRRNSEDSDEDILAARFTTERDAWLDSPAAESAGETGLATWRPSATASGEPVVELRSTDAMPEEDEMPPEEPEAEEETGEQDQGGIAGLLVQDAALWGSGQGDSGALE
jgi:hypothetical protein